MVETIIFALLLTFVTPFVLFLFVWIVLLRIGEWLNEFHVNDKKN